MSYNSTLGREYALQCCGIQSENKSRNDIFLIKTSNTHYDNDYDEVYSPLDEKSKVSPFENVHNEIISKEIVVPKEIVRPKQNLHLFYSPLKCKYIIKVVEECYSLLDSSKTLSHFHEYYFNNLQETEIFYNDLVNKIKRLQNSNTKFTIYEVDETEIRNQLKLYS
jgi:hypothetical protein